MRRCIGTMAVDPPRRRAARLRAHCVSLARVRACVGGARIRIRTARLISRANLRACIQWVSAVNASNHPPAMATRGYYYRRAGRYSFHLQLWRVRVQRPWEFAGSSARDSPLESGASTRTVATLHSLSDYRWPRECCGKCGDEKSSMWTQSVLKRVWMHLKSEGFKLLLLISFISDIVKYL